ncbi:hypothetical protein AB4Z22_39190 [Paenibacillus sp. TAF58]
MTIKNNSRFRRSTAVRRRIVVRLRTTDARITQNLGNGFLRSVFTNRVIPPNSSIELSLLSPANRRVISGGWSIRSGDPKTQAVFSTESYPRTEFEWVITVWNNTPDFQIITPYFITKRR